MQSFVNTITSQKVRDRLAVLRERPEIETLRYIMKDQLFLEWAHTVGVTSDDDLRSLAPAIPPYRLRKITAAAQESKFLWTGLKDAEFTISLVQRFGAPGKRVLDFGCGCGRVLRYLAQDKALDVSGVDANEAHVAWCAQNLERVTVAQCGPLPPLPFGDQSFDVIVAVSVFTHLPRAAMSAWLDELARVSSNGALLVLTTNGYAALSTIVGSETHQHMFGLSADEARSIADGLEKELFTYKRYPQHVVDSARAGEDYGVAFVHEQLVRTEWVAHGFEVMEYLRAGLRHSQDVVVMRTRQAD